MRQLYQENTLEGEEALIGEISLFFEMAEDQKGSSLPVVTVLNGGIGGAGGNTAVILEELAGVLRGRAEVFLVNLERGFDKAEVRAQITRSAGLVFGTGTYWDSWGSPLQKFLEEVTDWEGGAEWLGKPAAVIVTMHSVGGKGVLSRLQGVLSTLGCAIPPMSGLVCSMVNQLALDGERTEFHDDLWSREDLKIVGENLLVAIGGGENWTKWSVDAQTPRRLWVSRTAA